MPPKLISDDGKQIVIRPLAYCKEKDIENMTVAKGIPKLFLVICVVLTKFTTSSSEGNAEYLGPSISWTLETMFSAMQNITLSHLCDPKTLRFQRH